MPAPKLEDIDENDFITLGKAFMRSLVITHEIDPQEIEVPPTIDFATVDFVIAIDDSGGIEPLLNEAEAFHVSKQPFVTLVAYGLPVGYLDDFNADWNELRLQINKELNLSYLPPIHMRYMYGKTLEEKLRGNPNPYLNTDFVNQRLSWIRYTTFLMSHYSHKDEPHIDQSYFAHRDVLHNEFTQIMDQTNLWKDLRYLRRTKPHAYHFARSRLSSPLPKLLALMLGIINETLLLMGDKTAVILFDSFDASQGIANQTVQKIVEQLGFRQIRSILRVENSDHVPLVQAADVLAYSMNRRVLTMAGEIKPDTNLIGSDMDTHQASFDANAKWDEHPFAKNPHQHLMLQYAILREAARETNKGRKLFPLLVDNEEIAERLAANQTEKHTRVSILKDPSLSERD